MKKIHYRNIGFPKTGTTWLWSKLIRHPDIDGKLGDTFKEFRAKNYLDYRKIYEKYSISINFDSFEKDIKEILLSYYEGTESRI